MPTNRGTQAAKCVRLAFRPGHRHHAAGSLGGCYYTVPYLASHSDEEVHHGVRVLLVNGLGKKRVSSWQ